MGLSYATPVDLWACGCIFAELHTRTALFDGKYEKDQLCRIFEVLGTPSDEEWPENAAVLKTNFADFPAKAWNQVVPELEPQAEDLLEVCHFAFFSFNVLKRLTNNVSFVGDCERPSLNQQCISYHHLNSTTL